MPHCSIRTLILALALASGCAASVAKDQGNRRELDTPGPAPSGDAGVDGGIKGPKNTLPGDCSYENELMYLLGVNSNEPGPAFLYTFDPPSMLAKKITELDGCPDVDRNDGTWPIAMSIDVDGNAWVLFVRSYGKPGASIGELYQVDTEFGNCTDTKLRFAAPPSGWVEGGLGFIGPAFGSDKDRLFLGGVFTAGEDRPQLFQLDPQSLDFKAVGTFQGAPSGFWPSKLTGTGDGRLFAIAGTRWAEVDPVSGKLLTPLTDLKLPRDRFPGSAVGYWGDEFWIFESIGTPGDARAKIYRHELASGLTTEEGELNFHVTAAGVTTCAPTSPR